MTSFISPPCISAYIVFKTSEGPLYLLIRRCGKYLPGTWQMVSGGVEKGETAGQAALREIQEETGLIPKALYSADIVETFYMSLNDKIICVPVFVAFVENMNVCLSPTEHDAYEWLCFEEARDKLVWSEQKRAIKHIQENFVIKEPNPLLLIDLAYNPPSEELTLTRTGVYGIAIQDKKILLVKQNKGPHAGKWDLPGGKLEAEETIEEALHRELREEVNMTFTSMQLFKNITAVTEGFNEKGDPYLLHQIGLVYHLDNLTQLQDLVAELDYDWIDLEQLNDKTASPLVKEVLNEVKAHINR